MIRDEQLEKAADIDVAHPDENVMVRAAYIKEMAQELLAYREAERKSDMLTDSAWIAGAKFGLNCGVVGDNNALQASIESRIRERVEDKKERPK